MKYTVVIEQAVPEDVQPQLEQMLAVRFHLSAEQARKLASRRGGRLMKPTGRERATVLLEIFQDINAKVRLEQVDETPQDAAPGAGTLPSSCADSAGGGAAATEHRVARHRVRAGGGAQRSQCGASGDAWSGRRAMASCPRRHGLSRCCRATMISGQNCRCQRRPLPRRPAPPHPWPPAPFHSGDAGLFLPEPEAGSVGPGSAQPDLIQPGLTYSSPAALQPSSISFSAAGRPAGPALVGRPDRRSAGRQLV